ncbi:MULTISPECIES: TrsD/TraD family conjugative transfer protein [Lactobacillaceae]|uniref:Protein TrsD (Plasmid) [Lactobacillus casei str. Zhang] n=1 Tax=Lactiplantibacillus mudanjiangensis TaxID=1296538 RepID=A0A660DZU3_9LACO|nr:MULTISPECIES: TrsD/TraD family conjugative transfer protein [Lactobacillaceae]MCG0575000.1 conjugation protein [Lactiplantibacillus plantarum]MDV7740281.1 conjugal transfer protein [Leuconostoc mesenteroides]MDV7758438.1 conjugal transfer protein [Liquorilactobacillus mali]VDG25049.1 protein TrsD (plasmid) [Lactobacillus casei str. Zhang] [Lactiplantibacillus mudanjiangensis]VDG28934.1 protein TrsD (plasmid) [Lactobacillus casei str. Zhang] [Lactiplantibacillus mudanjiangensis]
MKLKNTKAKKSKLEWDYEPPKINGGKQTIDDMSLVAGMYENYEVTKTGNLVGILEVSGINLDLLNDNEQQDVFSDYGAFLMSTLGEGVDDSLQFIEPTIPVNMTEWLNGLKRKYLDLKNNHPEEKFKIQLIASYLDHFTTVQNSKNMTTKQHLLIVKVPIKDKTMESLDLAVNNLDEKINQVKRDLENALTDFDLTAKVLSSQEVQEILKNLINFKG